ncbi:MAG: hypothetical protein Rhirs2KO_13860 [Rhizobiaceae bacterium]
MHSNPSDLPPTPRTERRIKTLSPWVGLAEIDVFSKGEAEDPDVFHALHQPDYVNVLSVHKNGSVPMVRQFRPVVDRWTWEFAGGLVDEGESAGVSGAREVGEETGLKVIGITKIHEGFADVGRLTNRLFGYFAIVDGEVTSPEYGVNGKLVDGVEVRRMAANGEIALPSNMALLYLASISPEVGRLADEHDVDISWLRAKAPPG